jgi:ADP-heptose:LPS heptosyltransferase
LFERLTLSSLPPKHILVSRTDKIGDLILSLPVFQTLRAAFPQARLTALVNPYAKEIVTGHPAIDGVETVEKEDGVFSILERFKKLKPDVFLALYPRPNLALAAAWSGIPLRVGTAYRWYSFLFNEKIAVHRHHGDRHEVEYNLDLVKPLGITPVATKIEFPIVANDRDFVRDFLKEKGLRPKTKYVVVHPGHKGSALNWSPAKYGEAIRQLAQVKGLRVVLTAGPDETPLVSQVKTFLQRIPKEKRPILVIGELGLKQLAALYKGAACFLSGSTGTMHLAAAVGTPTVALFCPIPATTPVRWGPWGNEAAVLMPKPSGCPACDRGVCRNHDPMDSIAVTDVLAAVQKFLKKAGIKK